MHDSSFLPQDILLDYHGICYLLVYPVFAVADITGIEPNRVFTALVPIPALSIAWFATASTLRLGGVIDERRAAWIFAATSPVFILLSLFMHGRLLFAMAGSSLLLSAMLGWKDVNPPIVFIAVVAAFMLCSVASGTFVTAIAAFYFFSRSSC